MTPPARLSVKAYRAATVPPERVEQVRFMRWCRQNVTDLCWHTRNEGRLTELQRIRAAAEGVLAGVADVFGIVEAGPHARRPFAIELKRINGRPSDVTDPEWAFGRLVQERGGLWSWQPGADAAIAWCHAQGIVRPAGWRGSWVQERGEYSL